MGNSRAGDKENIGLYGYPKIKVDPNGGGNLVWGTYQFSEGRPSNGGSEVGVRPLGLACPGQ